MESVNGNFSREITCFTSYSYKIHLTPYQRHTLVVLDIAVMVLNLMTVSLCHDLVKTLSEHIIYGIILLKCIWLSFRFGGSTIVRNFDWSIFWPVTLLFWNNLPVFCRFLTAYVWVCNCSNCIWLLQAYAFFKPVPVSGYQTKSSRCMFNYHHFLIMWRIIVRFRNKVQRSWNFKNGYKCDRLRCFYIGRYCIFTYNKSGEGIPKEFNKQNYIAKYWQNYDNAGVEGCDYFRFTIWNLYICSNCLRAIYKKSRKWLEIMVQFCITCCIFNDIC